MSLINLTILFFLQAMSHIFVNLCYYMGTINFCKMRGKMLGMLRGIVLGVVHCREGEGKCQREEISRGGGALGY